MLDLNLAKAKIRDSLRQSASWPFLPYDDAVRLSAFWQIWDLESAGTKKIHEWQVWKFQQLIAHMRKFSHWWKQRIPQRVSTLADFPILTRSMLREQVGLEGPLRESDKIQSFENSTSGSSGQPLKFYVSAYNGEYNQIRYTLENFIQGRDFRKPKTSIRRMEKNFESPVWTDMAGKLFNTGPHRGLDLRTNSIPSIASWIVQKSIGYLNITPQYLRALLHLWELEGKAAPEALEIVTLGGTVDSELRNTARERMSAEIKDIYSCEEVGPIAFQCPFKEDFLHVATTNVFLEVVDQNGKLVSPGTSGRILITGLNNTLTPIVRYEVGDIGSVLTRCPCGWEGQSVTNLLGRATSLLKLPNGWLRPFIPVAKDWLSIAPLREYRVTQDAADHLLVELVSNIIITPDMETALARIVRLHTSELFNISFKQVDVIDWGRNYKRVEVRCLV